MEMENERKLISVREAAQILGVTRIRVAVLCKQGRFEGAKKIGSVWIIPRKSVENFVRLPPGVKPKTIRQEQEKAFINNILEQIKEGEEIK